MAEDYLCVLFFGERSNRKIILQKRRAIKVGCGRECRFRLVCNGKLGCYRERLLHGALRRVHQLFLRRRLDAVHLRLFDCRQCPR